jgi:hypothetical protein
VSSKLWEVKNMVKKGDKYECGNCGIVLMVDEACDCAPCDIVCCGAPMKQVKPKAKK